MEVFMFFFGYILGCIITSIIMRIKNKKKKCGYLVIDHSTEEEYMFAEFIIPTSDISSKDSITLEVKTKNYLSQ